MTESLKSRKNSERKCFVPGCSNGFRNNKNKYCLFTTPRDKTLLEKWANSIGRVDRILNTFSVVCEAHFEERFIERNYRYIIGGKEVFLPRSRPRLLEDAYPTLFNNLNFTTEEMNAVNRDGFCDPPEGWRKVITRRKAGKTAGNFDIYYYNSEGQKFRSSIEIENHLNDTGSILNKNHFNFAKSSASSEIDLSSSSFNKQSLVRKRGGTKKALQKNFNDIGSNLTSNGFDQLSTKRLETKSTLPSIKRGRGRGRKRLQTGRAQERSFKDGGFGLPSDQFSIQQSAEILKTIASSFTSTKRGRGIGRSRGRKRFQIEKALQKSSNDEGFGLSSDLSSIQQSTERLKTNTSSFTFTKRGRGQGRGRRRLKAPEELLNDEFKEFSLPADYFTIQPSMETSEANLSSSSTETSHSMPIFDSSSEEEEDLVVEPLMNLSSHEKYSHALSFLIPIEQPKAPMNQSVL